MEKTLTVIPARYASHRLPGKVLEEIHGFPMIYWVYQQVLKAKPGRIVVAADHPRVYDTLERLDIPYLATDSACKNGTERVHEVATKYPDVNYFVNIQGDEPLLNPNVIRSVLTDGFRPDAFKTAISRISGNSNNPSEVKVALSLESRIRFASRSLIPYFEEASDRYKIHGVYLYSRELLERFISCAPGPLEKLESVEQMRCIENDIPLIGIKTEGTERSVDTYEDLVYMRSLPASLFYDAIV
jgi:3-deoxy-manno-octulosonate cytidylyltransferase (CMP-KDO synthetase)